jgi:hypothetical protein
LTRKYGIKVFQSYLENRTPAAGRIFWAHGPDKRDITVLAIEPHPEDQKRGAYERIKLSALPPQSVTHVVKAEAVGELGVDQADDMAPGTKRATPFLHRMFAGQLRHQMIGNKVAELAQESKSAARWLVRCGLLHDPPCGRSTHRKPTLFYPSTFNPVGRL